MTERKRFKKKIVIISLISITAVAAIITPLIFFTLLYSTSKLGKMNIIGASYLYIAPGSGNKLFKVTDEGYILEVTYEDENGEPMSLYYEPAAIYDINNEYVIVCFGSNDINVHEGYLVRKVDGAVFSLSNAGFPLPQPNYYKNGKSIFTDSNGNLYYLARLESITSGESNVEMIKLNTENMDSITKTTYSPSEEYVEGFIVDANGNAAYYGRQKNEISGLRSIFRIKLGNGAFYNLPQHTANFWLGLNGTIFFLNSQYSNIIQQVNIDSIYNVTLSDYGSGYTMWDFSTFGSYLLKLNNRIIAVDVFSGKLFELYNPTNSPGEILLDGSPLSTITQAVASNNFYYLAGNDASSNPVLLKVNSTDDSYTSLYTAGTYDIYTMSVSPSDKLLFNALRMSDGTKVIGEIDASSTPANLTILDEISNTEMIVLERIS